MQTNMASPAMLPGTYEPHEKSAAKLLLSISGRQTTEDDSHDIHHHDHLHMGRQQHYQHTISQQYSSDEEEEEEDDDVCIVREDDSDDEKGHHQPQQETILIRKHRATCDEQQIPGRPAPLTVHSSQAHPVQHLRLQHHQSVSSVSSSASSSPDADNGVAHVHPSSAGQFPFQSTHTPGGSTWKIHAHPQHQLQQHHYHYHGPMTVPYRVVNEGQVISSPLPPHPHHHPYHHPHHQPLLHSPHAPTAPHHLHHHYQQQHVNIRHMSSNHQQHHVQSTGTPGKLLPPIITLEDWKKQHTHTPPAIPIIQQYQRAPQTQQQQQQQQQQLHQHQPRQQSHSPPTPTPLRRLQTQHPSHHLSAPNKTQSISQIPAPRAPPAPPAVTKVEYSDGYPQRELPDMSSMDSTISAGDSVESFLQRLSLELGMEKTVLLNHFAAEYRADSPSVVRCSPAARENGESGPLFDSSEPIRLVGGGRNPHVIKQQYKEIGRFQTQNGEKVGIRTVYLTHRSLRKSAPFKAMVLIYARVGESGRWQPIDYRKGGVAVEIIAAHRQPDTDTFSIKIYNFTSHLFRLKASNTRFRVVIPVVSLGPNHIARSHSECPDFTFSS